VELETGQEAYREIVRHHGAAWPCCRATPRAISCFVRQFRKPVEQIMLEVVAGMLRWR
jgi:hypothetical protein